MRLERVDLLRAFAILLVFLFHAQNVLFPGYAVHGFNASGVLDLSSSEQAFLNLWPVAFGWTGVQLFLLISGFVIHLGFLRHAANGGSFQLCAFFSKRFWRIYPPYALALLFFCVVWNEGRFPAPLPRLVDIGAHVLLVHNLHEITFFSIVPAFWSIALEAQLYLLYPVLLALRKRWSMRTIFFGTVLLSAALTILDRFFFPAVHGFAYNASVLSFWYIWCAGAFLAEHLHAEKRIFTDRAPALLVSVALFVAMILSITRNATVDLTVPLATFAWLAFFEWFLHVPLPGRMVRSLPFRWLGAIGLCSYSIYLLHQPILKGVLNDFGNATHMPAAQIGVVIGVFVVIFMISFVLYHVVEKPSVAFGARLRARHKGRVLNAHT